MHKLICGGLKLPEIYICGDRYEALPLIDAGIPYIITQRSDVEIVKIILFKGLRRRFPGIDWEKVLGVKCSETIHVVVPGSRKIEKREITDEVIESMGSDAPQIDDDEIDDDDIDVDEDASCAPRVSEIADGYRSFTGSCDMKGERVPIDSFCGDLGATVNIEQLQELGFLPKFMDDAVEAIRINIENRMRWRDGYNKKRGCCIGDYDYGVEAPNLIILDISASIPDGISGTMLELIATLREQANADLIITGSKSMYWSRDDELPSAAWIRKHISRSNEGQMFKRILEEHVAGRHFGNVISFGDYDSPDGGWFWNQNGGASKRSSYLLDSSEYAIGTKVDRLMCYHTTRKDVTGYAKWVVETNPDVEVVLDTSWCQVMKR